MPLSRLLTNVLLLLALVAGGPLPAFAADPGTPAPATAPCHDSDGPPPAAADADAGADCCGGEPGYCGCDCLQHAAAAPQRLHRQAHPPPSLLLATVSGSARPQRPASPDTRPPIA